MLPPSASSTVGSIVRPSFRIFVLPLGNYLGAEVELHRLGLSEQPNIAFPGFASPAFCENDEFYFSFSFFCYFS